MGGNRLGFISELKKEVRPNRNSCRSPLAWVRNARRGNGHGRAVAPKTGLVFHTNAGCHTWNDCDAERGLHLKANLKWLCYWISNRYDLFDVYWVLTSRHSMCGMFRS